MASQTLNRVRTLETAVADLATSVGRIAEEGRADRRELAGAIERYAEEGRADRAAAAADRAAAAAERRDLNRRLGDIANAQGRLVEDIVAPSIDNVLRSLLGLASDAPVAPSGPRLRLRHPQDAARMREVDVIAAHGVALVVEVKSRLAPERLAEFAASLAEAKEFLAPLGITAVIGAVATLRADPSVVAHGSRLGLVVLGVGDELMELKNPPDFVPRRI